MPQTTEASRTDVMRLRRLTRRQRTRSRGRATDAERDEDGRGGAAASPGGPPPREPHAREEEEERDERDQGGGERRVAGTTRPRARAEVVARHKTRKEAHLSSSALV